LSPDGDGFYTGVVTATTFKGDGSQLSGISVSSDVVDDTSPQLGGDLDTNSFEISLDDSHAVKFGDDSDFTIAHDGSNARLINTTGNLILFPKTGEYSVVCVPDAAVELYHDNVKTFETDANGIKLLGPEGGEAEVNLFADEGDDNADKWRIQALASGGLNIQNFTSGSWENNLIAYGDGAVELYHNNDLRIQTWSDGVNIYGDEGEAAILHLYADDGDDSADKWRLKSGTSSDFYIQNYASNSWETSIDATANGNVRLMYDNSKKLETTSSGVSITGNCNVDGNVTLSDNEEVQFGNSTDFRIYHDGSHSYIRDVGTGQLRIQSDVFSVENAAGTENILQGSQDGAVGLYYNNVEKFSTEGEGVRIRCSGNAGLRVDGTVADVNPRITFRRHSNDGGNAEPAAIQMTYLAGTTYESGHLDFYTNGDSGSAALSHRMRIRNDGHVGINDDAPSYLLSLKEASDTGYVINTATVNTALMLKNPQTGSTKNIAIYFSGCYSNGEGYISLVGDGGTGGDFRFALRSGGSRTDRMTITNDSTINGDFNDTSDINLKENIASIPSSIDKVKQLRPVTFDWKESYRPNNVSGFIAQEVKTIYPDLVRGAEWTAEDPGKHYTINTMGVVAHLTKALQEEIAKREALEARIAALEG